MVGLTTIVHTTHDHMFFYLMWAIFGGLSTLKMVSTTQKGLEVKYFRNVLKAINLTVVSFIIQ